MLLKHGKWAQEKSEEQAKSLIKWYTIFDTICDHPFGNGSLSLTQRQNMEGTALASAFGQLQQSSCGVHPGRQNENQRSSGSGFLHNLMRQEKVMKIL